MAACRLRSILAIAFAVLLTFAATKNTNVNDTTSADWSSLRFHFSIKRSVTRVHGHSNFSILATPNLLSDATKVLYDTFASFKEHDTLFDYSFVDGVAYVSRTYLNKKHDNPLIQCIDSPTLPPINSIVTALNSAERVSNIRDSDGTEISCSSGSTFKVLVNGILFGLCFSESSGFTMYGSDVDINVEYVKTDWPITIYKTNGQIEGECKKVALPTLVTSIGKSLLVGQPLPVSHKRKMKTAIEILLPASCTCKSKPRPCVFISGIGSLVEKEKNQDSFSYWGKITGHTPCCSSTKYAVLNTTKVFWTDAQLQQKVCDHILIESATSEGSIISDTIIFSYSMGGLLLAGAIANGRCSLNKSSTWVSTGTPIYGTMGSDYLQDVCVNKTTLVVEKLANFAELCPPKEGIKSMAYVNGTYSNNKLKMAYKAAQKAYVDNVYALMCSHSFSGVLSRYQAAFWVLGRIIPHKSRESDGAVEFSSCAGGFPASNFGNDFRDRFYSSRLNHYDLAFRAGDALLDRTKMPMKWFECLL